MSNTFRAQQDIHISGWECGTEIELKMVVTFTVMKGYPATLEQPAEPATVEVDKVRFFDGKDELTLPWSIEDRFTSAEGFKDWLMQEAADQHEAALDARAEARREDILLNREGF
jgi:hypothetical protein